MSVTTKNVPNHPNGRANVSILLVTPYLDDLACLRNILHHPNWSINHCSKASEARGALSAASHSIAFTERELPDGDWRDVLRSSDSQPEPPLVLVASKHADETLWAEVLNLGGYDVLLKPFDRAEVTRVVGMAWRCWAMPTRRSVAGETGTLQAVRAAV